jgi:hypothetical protein
MKKLFYAAIAVVSVASTALAEKPKLVKAIDASGKEILVPQPHNMQQCIQNGLGPPKVRCQNNFLSHVPLKHVLNLAPG